MKRILLLRHAQTAGKQAGQRDYDRLLTPEGEAQARKTGLLFIRDSVHPDLIISSSAARAKATALNVNEALNLPGSSMVFHESLYLAESADWIDHIRQLPEPIHCVLCVGHNPILSILASQLAKRAIELPAGGVAFFESDAPTWAAFESQVREIHPPLSAH